MTHTLACEMNKQFAAFAPFHGQRHIGFSCKPENGRKVPIINIWGRNDRIIPGNTVKSANAWYYLPVMAVQDAFADYNGCDKTNGQQRYISTDYGGSLALKCTAFRDGCENFPTVQCNWKGGHRYPIDFNTSSNFILPTVYVL